MAAYLVFRLAGKPVYDVHACGLEDVLKFMKRLVHCSRAGSDHHIITLKPLLCVTVYKILTHF